MIKACLLSSWAGVVGSPVTLLVTLGRDSLSDSTTSLRRSSTDSGCLGGGAVSSSDEDDDQSDEELWSEIAHIQSLSKSNTT